MKTIIFLLTILVSLSALAEVVYPVKNFKYISDFDYREEVQDSDKFVVMIFSSKECLERVIVDRSCWLFEKKLDYFVPSFSPKIKMVGFNTYFENYTVVSQFHIQKKPTVIIIKNNQILKRIEPNYALPDITVGRMNWQDELLKETVETIYKIR
jgi:hypothetical protein